MVVFLLETKLNMINNKQKQKQNKKNPKQNNAKKSKKQEKVEKAPVAQMRMMKPNKPRMSTSKNGSIRINHKEFVQNVSATQAPWQVVSFASINPGITGLFPWLSNIAANFETYKFHSLKFKYLTRAPTSTAGSVYLAVDYDASDAPPISEQQISTYEGVVNFAVWMDKTFDSDKSALSSIGPKKFVRTGNPPQGTDVKTYDVGNFIIALADSVGNYPQPWGKLWVEYDIELFTPQQNPASTLNSSGGGVFNFTLNTGSIIWAVFQQFGYIQITQDPTTSIFMFKGLQLGQEYTVQFCCPFVNVGTVVTALTLGSNVGMSNVVTLSYFNDNTGTGGVQLQFNFTATSTTAQQIISGNYSGGTITTSTKNGLIYCFAVNGYPF